MRCGDSGGNEARRRKNDQADDCALAVGARQGLFAEDRVGAMQGCDHRTWRCGNGRSTDHITEYYDMRDSDRGKEGLAGCGLWIATVVPSSWRPGT